MGTGACKAHPLVDEAGLRLQPAQDRLDVHRAGCPWPEQPGFSHDALFSATSLARAARATWTVYEVAATSPDVLAARPQIIRKSRRSLFT